MSKTKKVIRNLYIQLFRNRIKNPMLLQRMKMLYFFPQYKYLLGNNISKHKLKIFFKFVRIDFGILHAHKPIDFLIIAKRILEGNEIDTPKGVILEAGCWNGGSSAKLSILAKLTGRKLHIYDSFEGVEPIGKEDDKTHDFSYEYSSPMENTKNNIQKYGNLEVCSFFKGYFENSMKDFNSPFFLCYIDCDLAKGSAEVIESILPVCCNPSYILSQDYAINAVKQLLDNKEYFDEQAKKNSLSYFKTVHTYQLVEFKFNKIES